MVRLRHKKAFTLIELLVVIAVIALLMAVLMPALSAAKKQAYGSVCMGNQKGLILAYVAYSDDNDGKLVSANTFPPSAWNPPPPDEIPWAQAPKSASTYYWQAGVEVTDDQRFLGIMDGSLYPYCKNVKLYHCPGDQRHKMGTSLGQSSAYTMYRSYGIQGGLNGEELHDALSGFAVKRLSGIKSPVTTYVFVEEYYEGEGANYNAGSFLLHKDPTEPSWWNIMAVWHGDSSTLSFADGHAVRKKWKDKRTLKFAEKRDDSDYTQTDNPDLMYMLRHYAVPLPRD